MARGVNKVILIGQLGQDPEVRFTQQGNPIANISMATSEKWKDKQGQLQEKTEWHRIVVFGKLADIVQQYVRKGSKLYVEGKLQTRKWQDQQGNDKYSTEVVVDGFSGQIQMLDGKQEGQGNAPLQQHQHQQRPQQAQTGPVNSAPTQQAPGGYDDFDDDIPF